MEVLEICEDIHSPYHILSLGKSVTKILRKAIMYYCLI